MKPANQQTTEELSADVQRIIEEEVLREQGEARRLLVALSENWEEINRFMEREGMI